MPAPRASTAGEPAASPHSILAPTLLPIPAGWFTMGHAEGFDSERPAHRVWVDAFQLASCPVTNAEYALFRASTRAAPPPFMEQPEFSGPQQPVVGISWFEAVAYCAWLASATGRAYRLPTEAEWERAARGGREGELFPWGDEPPQSRHGYATRWRTGPEVVGSSPAADPANSFGVQDMCENVHEWCSDWFDGEYYANSPQRNPHGPERGTRRASRGGSWRHHVKASYCHTRSSIPPALQYADYGFRVACDAA
jgi:formylglycine-generating enzyme